jgi:hypothetical protein
MAAPVTAVSGSDEALRDRLIAEFRRRKNAATTADLVAATGLPVDRVSAELPSISDEYGARLRVTESGEILWSFPEGMKSRLRGFGPGLRRFWKGFRKGFVTVATFFFKAWIAVMLVGYFALFILLALVALLASIAMQTAGRGDSDGDEGGGAIGLFLSGRVIGMIFDIWFYSELFKDPRQRQWEHDRKAQKRREGRPLHKAIFSFVFGEPDPNAGWDETERKTVVAFLQANKGLLTMPEFRALTGLSPLEAESRINRYLSDFKGSPEVSEAGTVLFAFPDLLRRAERSDGTFGQSIPLKQTEVFSANKGKMNSWFAIINLVNIAFGSYFIAGSILPHHVKTVIYRGREVVQAGWDYLYLITSGLAKMFFDLPNPSLALGIGLGVVPVTFGLLFYGIPALRNLRLKRRNEAIKVENLRRFVYPAILDKPIGFRPEGVAPTLEAANPADKGARDRIVTELAAAEGGEPGSDGGWTWTSIVRAKQDVAKARAAVKTGSTELGKTVFDSHDGG